MSSDEAGGVGRKKNSGASKLLEFSKTPHGRTHQKFSATLSALEKSDIQVRRKNAGGDGVHANSRFCPFQGKRFRQSSYPSFAGTVCGDFIERHERSDGGNV